MSGLSKRCSLSVPPDIFVDIILEMEKKPPWTGKHCSHANIVRREKRLTNVSEQTSNHRVLTDVYLSDKNVRCFVWPPYCWQVPAHAQFTGVTQKSKSFPFIEMSFLNLPGNILLT